MEQGSEPVFSIEWEGLGLESRGCIQWEVNSDYLQVSDTWSATIRRPAATVRPGQLEGCPVTITLDNATLLVGRCDVVDTTDTPGLWVVSGHDYLWDLLVGCVDPALTLSEGDTLQSAVLRACGPAGITSLIADGGFALRTLRCGQPIGRRKTKVAPGEVKIQDLKPNPGRLLSDWLAHLATRHGLTVQPGSSRNEVQLHAPDYEQETSGSLVRTEDKGNHTNIVSGRARRDCSRLVTSVVMTSQAGATAEARESGLVTVDAMAAAADFLKEPTGVMDWGVTGRRKPGNPPPLKSGQFYRLYYRQDKEARNAEQLKADAVRAMAERLHPTLQYSATVKGLKDPKSGAFYATDTILSVEDAIADVSETLWVSGRSMSNSGSGPRTKLSCWRPGSFLIA